MIMTNRTKHSILNVIASLAMTTVSICIGLVTQRAFLQHLGLEYAGVNTLFINIVSMIGMVELGLGTTIVYHLYEPISKNDKNKIISLLHLYKKGYWTIALAIAFIGILVLPFVNIIVGVNSIHDNINIIYVLFVVDSVLSYLMSYKRSIMYACQKSYIINAIRTVFIVCVNIAQIYILFKYQNYYAYLVIGIVMRVIENVVVNKIIDRMYPYINDPLLEPILDSEKKDIFVKIKAIFMHKIGKFAAIGSDNIVISIFLGVGVVGLYSNYYMVIYALTTILKQIFYSLNASIGNLIVTSQNKKIFLVFKNINFINLCLAVIGSVGFFIAANDFILLWLGDSKFLIDKSTLLILSICLFFQLMRFTMNSFKEASGVFVADRYMPLIEATINVVLSVIFVNIFGLAGIFVGTLVSELFIQLVSYPKYTYTKIFKQSYFMYYAFLLKYAIVMGLSMFLTVYAVSVFDINNIMQKFIIDIVLAISIPSLVITFVFSRSKEFSYAKDIVYRLLKR